MNDTMIHCPNYDFNDDLIDFASKFWYNIALEAFEI